MGKLEGKIAVVAGGNSGLGLAAAERFVAEGAYVFINGRRPAELDAAVKQIGRNVTAVQGDVGKLEDLDRLYTVVKEQEGHLDILFANAGAGAFVPLEQITEEHFEHMFNTDVKGTLFTVQKALPLMAGGGSIVINGSMVSIKGIAGLSTLAASKAALRSFARTWPVELKGRNIRVNVISPGTVIERGAGRRQGSIRSSNIQATDLAIRGNVKPEIGPKVSPALRMNVNHKIEAIIFKPTDGVHAFVTRSVVCISFENSCTSLLCHRSVTCKQCVPCTAISCLVSFHRGFDCWVGNDFSRLPTSRGDWASEEPDGACGMIGGACRASAAQ